MPRHHKTYAGQLKELLILSWVLILPRLSIHDLEALKDQFCKMADHQIRESEMIWKDIQDMEAGEP